MLFLRSRWRCVFSTLSCIPPIHHDVLVSSTTRIEHKASRQSQNKGPPNFLIVLVCTTTSTSSSVLVL